MDLELTDEQTWLIESIETLLSREWPAAEHAHEAGSAERDRLWRALLEFGVLEVGGQDRLGAVELCLVARALGAHLGSVPFLGSAAVRYALAQDGALGDDRIAIALLEPGRGWRPDGVRTTVEADGLHGEKAAVEHADSVDRFAVVALVDGEPGLVLAAATGVDVEAGGQAGMDASAPLSRVRFSGTSCEPAGDRGVVDRLTAVAGLLAAAEATGAAERVLTEARDYAAERRQFGRTIGSYQALRHLMADMYVRRTSSWSTVLYAAAALDDGIEDAELTASVAKAYVSRAAREIAHGALQVFGGIAFTEEHPAHRFLRRIVVREQQFGDAAHHEREIGRRFALARAPVS
jgi:alkylation response protein AidB-like acyl-CoA dehydrogenase